MWRENAWEWSRPGGSTLLCNISLLSFGQLTSQVETKQTKLISHWNICCFHVIYKVIWRVMLSSYTSCLFLHCFHFKQRTSWDTVKVTLHHPSQRHKSKVSTRKIYFWVWVLFGFGIHTRTHDLHYLSILEDVIKICGKSLGKNSEGFSQLQKTWKHLKWVIDCLDNAPKFIHFHHQYFHPIHPHYLKIQFRIMTKKVLSTKNFSAESSSWAKLGNLS